MADQKAGTEDLKGKLAQQKNLYELVRANRNLLKECFFATVKFSRKKKYVAELILHKFRQNRLETFLLKFISGLQVPQESDGE